MSLWSIPPLILACIALYVSVFHLLIYARGRAPAVHLSFGFVCLFIGIYDILAACLYNTSSAQSTVTWNRAQIISLAFAGSSFLWFIYDYTGQTSKRVLTAFIAAFGALGLCQAIDPSGLSYSVERVALRSVQALGHQITYYDAKPGMLANAEIVLGNLSFVYNFAVCIRFYRSGHRRKAIPLLIALAIFFVGVGNDTAVHYELYNFLYVLYYAFFSMIALMTYAISNEFIDAAQTKEALLVSQGRLRESEKLEAIGRLAGGIAHDFNNLLVPIMGYASWGVKTAPKTHPHHEMFTMILDAAEHAKGLTQQFLAFGRKQVLQKKALNLPDLLSEMRSMLLRLVEESIGIDIALDTRSAVIEGDPVQIRQVLMNLTLNARDAMPEGGTLSITCKSISCSQAQMRGNEEIPAGNYALLSVRDCGRGMTEETSRHIFEPFFTTKQHEGTGLGLATVYGIVKQHGGHIRTETAPGKGTTFDIFFPITDKAAERTPHPPPARQPSRGGIETLLVVEDESTVRDFVVDVLTAAGYRVLSAEDGEQARRVADAHSGPIDLLISDIVLPKMNGDEVFRTLRGQRTTLRVVFMSGYTSDTVFKRSISQDSIFLAKPFSPSELTSAVHRALHHESGPTTPPAQLSA